MRIVTLNVLVLFLFQACSLKSPENKWEYSSASAFNSYTQNFLTDNIELAEDDLRKAIKYSKQSANLEQLARIYLGVCSLNISVGIKDSCEEYNLIEELVLSKELKAYFLMLQNKLEKEYISNLPNQYQDFIKYRNLGEFDLCFKTIKEMQQTSSKFIAASLIKEHLKKTQINYLIEKASFYGFKKNMLFWLEYLKEKESNPKIKKRIEKKLRILKN